MRRRGRVLGTAQVDATGRRLADRVRIPVERATPNDMLQLTYDAGSVPAQVGAVLLMAGPAPEPDAARRAVALRVASVPRLRQRLQRVPFGCGRPI